MKQDIKVTFGITRSGKNLFYVEAGSDNCFWIEEDNAEEELNYDFVKSTLQLTKECVDYIQNMYKKWYEEFVKCKR